MPSALILVRIEIKTRFPTVLFHGTEKDNICTAHWSKYKRLLVPKRTSRGF